MTRRRCKMLGAAIMCFALCIVFALLLLVVDAVRAADFEWKYTAEQQKAIDGFRIYDGNHKVVLDKINPSARKATIADPDECTSYYSTAYKGNVESDESTIIAYCPPTIVIPPTGGFVVVKPSK